MRSRRAATRHALSLVIDERTSLVAPSGPTATLSAGLATAIRWHIVRQKRFLYPEFGPVTLVPFDDCGLYQRRQSAERPMVDYKDAARLIECGIVVFAPEAVRHGAGGAR